MYYHLTVGMKGFYLAAVSAAEPVHHNGEFGSLCCSFNGKSNPSEHVTGKSEGALVLPTCGSQEEEDCSHLIYQKAPVRLPNPGR